MDPGIALLFSIATIWIPFQSTWYAMQTDPFERFERSRSGLLIPVAIFFVGACLTWYAIQNLNRIVVETGVQDPRPANEQAPVLDANEPNRQANPIDDVNANEAAGPSSIAPNSDAPKSVDVEPTSKGTE